MPKAIARACQRGGGLFRRGFRFRRPAPSDYVGLDELGKTNSVPGTNASRTGRNDLAQELHWLTCRRHGFVTHQGGPAGPFCAGECRILGNSDVRTCLLFRRSWGTADVRSLCSDRRISAVQAKRASRATAGSRWPTSFESRANARAPQDDGIDDGRRCGP
jgi:hypothetical protein